MMKIIQKHDPEILRGIARGPWVYLWSYERDVESDEDFSEIMSRAPQTPPWVTRWASELADAVVAVNGLSLRGLYETARKVGFRDLPEAFGRYLGLRSTDGVDESGARYVPAEPNSRHLHVIAGVYWTEKIPPGDLPIILVPSRDLVRPSRR